jgi:heme exporter protein C
MSRHGRGLRACRSELHGHIAGHRHALGRTDLGHLVSQLFVLFFFLGYIALRGAIEDRDRADRASAVLAIVGVVNVPIVHYSVEWWNSLHQGATLLRSDGPSMPMSMLWPLLVMIAAYTFYFLAIMLMRAQAEVLRRERGGTWLREELSRAEA